jgi:hypothetical protein
MGESESVVTVKKVKKAFEEPEETEDVEELENEDEEDTDEEDGDFDFDMETMNLGSILQNFLVNEDGENVCDVLSGLKKSVDTQNKIMMKIVNLFENKKK